MGNFRLGHNIVVRREHAADPPRRATPPPRNGPRFSPPRSDRRFGEYDGDRLYHIGIAIDGYALAPPGVPLVLNPRSILVLSVNVWDDAAGVKLHEEPEQILVMEGASTETAVVGSGIARTREEQMQVLARNAARRIQQWMLDNPEWFEGGPRRAALPGRPRTQPEPPEVALADTAVENARRHRLRPPAHARAVIGLIFSARAD